MVTRRKSAHMAKFLDLSKKLKINIFRLLRKVPEGGKIWIKLLNRKHAELSYYIMKKKFQTKFPTFQPPKVGKIAKYHISSHSDVICHEGRKRPRKWPSGGSKTIFWGYQNIGAYGAKWRGHGEILGFVPKTEN